MSLIEGNKYLMSGTDFTVPSDLNSKQNRINVVGLLKGSGSGNVSVAVANTDYQKIITSGTGVPSGGANGDIYIQY